ncbi:MAG: HIT family protein [Deltaproteobacteria bacterium]|jgi:histidine triad (HIT) family protein|nr:HIT family protein [Deltaproteobacteria bacterium]
MAGCIFCKIIRGESPCEKVYEDERVISFLDINPVSAGHTLVLPRKHFVTLFDIPEEDLKACTLACQKIAKAVLSATKASGLNLLENNYRAAGQLVDHVHFHLIPRFPYDNLRLWPAEHGRPPGTLAEMLARIKAEL